MDTVSKHTIETLGLLALAWRAFNTVFLASPVGRIIALFTTLFLLLDDYIHYKQFGRKNSLLIGDGWIRLSRRYPK